MLAQCSRCFKTRSAHRDRKTGKIVCDVCKTWAREQNPARLKPCGRCETMAIAAKLDADGNSVCRNCYRKERCEVCSLCGRNSTVETRNVLGDPICQWCYNKSRYHDMSTYEICYGCGQRKYVSTRDRASGYAICSACRRMGFPAVYDLCWCSRKKPLGKYKSKPCPLGHPKEEPIHLRIVFTAQG